ncbi:PREDICTED: MICOS complex subunit Mic60-like [Eufriesea mexicana]|uniref:MICOS complex subunit Mic60-like n=1 Tax=Eufriesea mexicana TaxID=516756 RepID=UPI00083C44C8|nr:PREDICTED: MICOS complex subunit Mic60-like [Eufriesea mexicana]
MFRIGLKFPCNGLNRIKKHGSSRLYLTTRCYETRARVKYDSEWRFFKDVKFMSKIPGHRYSTKSSKSDRSRGSTTTLITLATVAIGASGVLYYAKHDPEVRATLEGWIPGTDKAIQIIFQEKSTYFEFIRTCFETLQQTLISALFGEKSQEESAPKPAFVPLVDKKEPPINDPYTEIRVSKEKGEEIEIVAEKPSPPAKDVPKELMPKNLVELETSCGETASKAIAAYQKAACAIQDYNQDVIKVVESANVTVGSTVWNRLKDATEKRKEAIKEAEEHANVALNSLRKMYDLMDDPKFEAPSHMKTAARRNIKKILDDVDVAKKKYELEVESGNMAERYWKQVKEARENFNEELQILFPDINIQKKKLAIDENAFDLFVLHMYNKVNRLQKELEKLKTINGSKLKAALKSSGDVATEEQLNTLVCMELDSEKLILEDQFNKKNSEFRIQGSEFKTEDSELRIQNPEFRTQGLELRTQGLEFRTQDSEFRIQGSEFRTEDSELRIQNPELRTQGLEFRIQGSEFRTEDSELRIQNLEFRTQY